MGNAIIIRSPGILTNPGDAPQLPPPPDIVTGLLWRHRGDALATGHADGASITAWPADAGSRAAAVTLAQHSPDPLRAVTYKANALNGHGAAVFDAENTQSIVAGSFSGLPVLMPYTSYVVVKAVNEGSVVTGTGADYLSIRRFSFGRAAAGAGTSTAELATLGNVDAPGPMADNNWHIIVVVFDGADSFIQVDNSDPVPGPLGVATPARARLTHVRMGSNPGANGQWLEGEIAEHGGYARALNQGDVDELVATLRTRYDL